MMASSTDAKEIFRIGQLVMIKVGPLAGRSGYVQSRSEYNVQVAMGPSKSYGTWVLAEYVEAVNA